MKTLSFLIFAAMISFLPTLDASVVAYWRFENDLLDSSGNGHGATGGSGYGYSTNVPGSVINPGSLGNVASQDPSDTAPTTVLNSTALNNVFSFGSWTVEAFVNINGIQDFRRVLSNVNDTAKTGIYFAVGAGAFAGGNYGYNGNDVATAWKSWGSGLATNTWYHVAWVGSYTTNNGTSVSFYLNGTNMGSMAFYAEDSGGSGSHITMGTDDWQIGGAANSYNGLIDELRISDQALTSAQFLQAVPEPHTLALLPIGLLLVFLTVRQKRAATQRRN